MIGTAPAGSGDYALAGTAAGEHTVPVAVNIGAEERGFAATVLALGSDGTVLKHHAIGRRTAAGLDWQMTGTNFTFDSDNVLSFEVPEVSGVSWAAVLSVTFTE